MPDAVTAWEPGAACCAASGEAGPVRRDPGGSSDPALRKEVAEGIAYLHSRVGGLTSRTLESSSFLYALIELLVEKDILTIEELDARMHAVAPRLRHRFEVKNGGVAVQDSAHDKYAPPVEPKIDCADRVALCKAACCKMVFPLSHQDVDEGVVRWNLGQPFVIAKGADGYCQHLDREGHHCTVHAQRPLPCRVYDCRGDRRIWLDFERRIVNPKLEDPAWPRNLTREEALPEGIPHVP